MGVKGVLPFSKLIIGKSQVNQYMPPPPPPSRPNRVNPYMKSHKFNIDLQHKWDIGNFHIFFGGKIWTHFFCSELCENGFVMGLILVILLLLLW